MTAEIAGARLALQIDIGFGDAVTPAVQEIDYPSLLDMPAPRLRAYPPETVAAEKAQALVALGMLNSRMKDFFDLWAISETFFFDGPILADAMEGISAPDGPCHGARPLRGDESQGDSVHSASRPGPLRRQAVRGQMGRWRPLAVRQAGGASYLRSYLLQHPHVIHEHLHLCWR